MLEFISEYGTDIVAIIVAIMTALKVIVRLTPTLKDDEVFSRIDRVLESLIPNYKLPENEDTSK
jgi:acetolactate synthase small subunit